MKFFSSTATGSNNPWMGNQDKGFHYLFCPGIRLIYHGIYLLSSSRKRTADLCSLVYHGKRSIHGIHLFFDGTLETSEEDVQWDSIHCHDLCLSLHDLDSRGSLSLAQEVTGSCLLYLSVHGNDMVFFVLHPLRKRCCQEDTIILFLNLMPASVSLEMKVQFNSTVWLQVPSNSSFSSRLSSCYNSLIPVHHHNLDINMNSLQPLLSKCFILFVTHNQPSIKALRSILKSKWNITILVVTTFYTNFTGTKRR